CRSEWRRSRRHCPRRGQGGLRPAGVAREKSACAKRSEKLVGRRGFDPVEIFRIGEAVYFGAANEFSATAVGNGSKIAELRTLVVVASEASGAMAARDTWSENDFLPDGDAGDTGAELGDFAGDVAAGDMREWNGDAGQAAADPQVEMIERAGADANEDF